MAALAALTHEPRIEFSALIWQAGFSRTLGKRDQTKRLLNQSAMVLEQLESAEVDLERERAALLLGLARMARDIGDGGNSHTALY